MNENSISSFCAIKNVVLDIQNQQHLTATFPMSQPSFLWLVNDRVGSKCKATGLQTAISPKIYLLVVIPAREFQKVC